jgi:polyvinyl alcohol dehydrogenase (cytochrome)
MRRPGRAALLAAATAATALSATAAGAGPAAATPAASPATVAWTVYHGDPAGSGTGTLPGPVDTSSPAWTSPALDGQLYGEPLVSGGRVFVATENDTVYALSASTGTVIWSRHLASPVPASSLPCGDISPTVGITGTPVIDPARGEIFVVADEQVNGEPAHVLAGLSTATGVVRLTEHVDPPGAYTPALLQRTGLALTDGRVVFGYGGNDGDCSTYRGRVVSVPEGGGTPAIFTVDSAAGQSQGAVWMGGAAPAVDRHGNVWVSVGNGSVLNPARAYDHSDSALELSPQMHLEQFFAPVTWASDNAADRDFSTAPALLADGRVVLAGKSRIVFLLDGEHLGGIGGQQAKLGPVCDEDIDGGMATVGTTVYLPCLSGIVAVSAAGSSPGLRVLWTSRIGGGPPIVAGGLVWSISRDGALSGIDPATGKLRQKTSIGAPANHFPTPGAGDGLLLAPSYNKVVAFRAGTGSGAASPSTGTGSAASPSTTGGASPGSQPAAGSPGSTGGGPPPAAIGGIAAGVLILAGGAGWLIYRRRRPSGTEPPS